MQISNIETFKVWLAKTMGPICDADPGTLAKYVLALLKKEKPESELRLICVNELEAFLNTKTKDFVELLFATLKEGSYEGFGPKELPLTANELSTAVPSGVPSVGKIDVDNSRSQEAKVLTRPNVSTVGASSRGDRRDSFQADRRSKSRDRNLTSHLGIGGRSLRTTSRNEEDHRIHASRSYNRRGRNRSHTRSRERRIPISRRLGYRSDLRPRVESFRGRNDRHPRDDRTYRRRSRSRRAHSRSRSRTRSRSKVRSPPRVYSHMRAWSRSRSRSLSPLQTPASPNAAWSSKRASRSRSSEGRDENAYRITMPLDVVMSNSSAAIGERAHPLKVAPPDISRPPPSKARCRDYDEQGLCLLGNLCPYDHGIDPVIIEDINLPVPAGLITFPGGQPAPVRIHAPVPHSLAPLPSGVLTGPQMSLVAPQVVPLISSGASVIGPHQSATVPDLLPSNVVMDSAYSSTVKSSALTELNAVVSLQSTVNRVERNIIPVFPWNSVDGKRVVIPNQREDNLTHVNVNRPNFTGVQDARYVITQAGRSLDQNFTSRQLPFGMKPVFDPSRLGTRESAITSNGNTTLELAGIPTHLNTISAINQELSKYGTIVNIQVYYNGLADRALVSFTQSVEAAAALHSSEPVFNNRFVTVSWYSVAKQVTVPEVKKLSVKERLGTRPVETTIISSSIQQPFSRSSTETDNDGLREQSEKKMIIVSSSGALTKTVFNRQLSNNTAKHTERNTVVDVTSQANNRKDLAKEQMKMRLEIAKQKQLIMKKHVEKQKALLLKLESPDLGAEEKKSVIEKIKILESHVQKMGSELNNSAKTLDPINTKLPDVSVKANTTNHFPQEQFKSRAEILKSILDTELDLIAKDNQGVDTTDLRKKLAILKSQATAQGLSGSRRGNGQPFRGRGGSFTGRGRGRRGPMALAAKLIDRRPKQLLVSGFSPSTVDQVMVSASKFSGVEYTKHLSENDCILITFHSRHDAEKAAVEGLSFLDRNLLMTWFDDRKPTKRMVEKKEEENMMDIAEEEEADVGENAEAERKFVLEDSESEVELIVEDDDYKDEELSNSVTIGFDEYVLDESELLRLDEDDDNEANPPEEAWHR